MQVTALRFCRLGLSGWVLALADRNKAIFMIICTMIIGVAFFPFVNEYPLYMCTGFLGGWSVLRLQDKARVRTDAEGCALIKSRLKASRFIEDGELDSWRPPLPGFLRWNDTVVKFIYNNDSKPLCYEISGPYILLKQLIRGLTKNNS